MVALKVRYAMSKKLTTEQIQTIAKDNNIPYAALRAVIEVECKGSGFNSDNTPVILFERHIFRQQLIANGKKALADRLVKERPDICNTTMGGYGKYSQQHNRMNDAAKYDRTSALESASWGIGQVMGFHWKSLGYPTLQSFINAMYKDEASQLDAMIRYIKVNKLDVHLRNLNWASFAKGYNGASYEVNKYDEKLAAAYNKFK